MWDALVMAPLQGLISHLEKLVLDPLNLIPNWGSSPQSQGTLEVPCWPDPSVFKALLLQQRVLERGAQGCFSRVGARSSLSL